MFCDDWHNGPTGTTTTISTTTTSTITTSTTTTVAEGNEHLIWGEPGTNGQLIIREGYALLHDGNKKVSLWISYHLTKQDLMGTVERTDDFRPDTEIPAGQRAELEDYSGSGYDRGHMAPAGDMKRSEKVMSESFFLSNMCPQVAGLNRGKWRILEEKTRDFTQNKEESWIITGPVFMDTNGDGEEDCLEKIGPNLVWVPTHFYKIVITEDGEVDAISFLMPNETPEEDIEYYQVTIDSIEKVTGLDFLNELADSKEDIVESSLPDNSLFLSD